MNYTFGKSYKLCSKKKIEETYQKGVQVKSFPFFAKILWTNTADPGFQVVFVVPKKKFKRATSRNQIRRYIREAVRLEKHLLESFLIAHSLELNLFLTYAGEADPNLPEIQKAIRKLLKKITHEIQNQ